jgi:thymidylate synthase
MNRVDSQYIDLLKDILTNGVYKETRAGCVKSVFGRQMRFSMKDGLPILTTKKVFTKGVIHELLWFLKGDTNIKYLVGNGVHIWDDDAYRHYLDNLKEHNNLVLERNSLKDAETYYDRFLRRFKSQQYKRRASPEGIKICDVALSPRGEFKMPGDLH